MKEEGELKSLATENKDIYPPFVMGIEIEKRNTLIIICGNISVHP